MKTNNNNGEFQTGHIGLNVRNLERSKEFYGKVFGFDILAESEEEKKVYAFLGKGDKIVVTLWQQSDQEFSKQSAGLHHLSFEVETIEQVKTAENLMKEMGVNFHYKGIVSHREGSQSGGIFFEDPDGIRLEIYAPTDANYFTAPNEEAPSCGFF